MTYIAGQHNFICDVCGFKYKSSEKRKLWNGLIVCPEDWEPDHPQKYIRVQPDGQPVADPRPRPEDDFEYVCYMYASHPYADIAEADCAVVGRSIFTYQQTVQLKGST